LKTELIIRSKIAATLVRLISITGIIAYYISGVQYLLNVKRDPRMLLPAWIVVSSTITLGYHIIRHSISEYRNLSTSIAVFAALSFLSTLVLLQDSHAKRGRVPWAEGAAWMAEVWGVWWERVGRVRGEL